MHRIAELRSLIQSEVDYSRDFGDTLIPVAYHIIASTDSSLGLDTALMYAEMDTVTLRYAAAGMTFYQCGDINYYYDDDYVDFEKNIDEDICDTNDLPDVLNIWFAHNVFSSSGSICGYAYLSGPKNRVVVDNDCADNSSTLAHEIGHYFSLLHTHSTSGGDELVNGSNCAVAGDYLCDTPADPNISGDVSGECFYTGNETDSNGDTYVPDTRNIMSYSRKACRDSFSFEQNQQMLAYLISYRNYLNCDQIITGSQAPSLHPRINVFPNPAIGMLNISMHAFEPIESAECIILDAAGRTVFRQVLSAPSKSLNLNVDVDWPSGYYILRFRLNNWVGSRQIIIN